MKKKQPLFKKLMYLPLLLTLFSLNVIAQSPVERHGRLQVNGNRILNASGEITSLAGNSLFWSNAGDTSDYYNAETIDFLVENWNSSLIRIAMGVKENWDGGTGYIDSPQAQETKIRKVIDAAIANGIYVIIDWHTHEAELYTDEAVAFFTRMANLYGDTPNVMYEIYNEPINQSWPVIKNYAEQVIAGIRSKDPDNLIIVGTSNYSQEVDVASRNPIIDNNVAYTLHFYAAYRPHDNLRNVAQTALDNNVALFVTEWGTILNTGQGAPDLQNTTTWMSFLKDKGISHANWSLSDKAFPETGSIVQAGQGISGLLNDQLTTSGQIVKNIIQNWDTPTTTGPTTSQCNTIECIRNAMETAQAGDEIIIASGTYNFEDKIKGAFNHNVYLYGSANGNSANPIILRGANAANPPVFNGLDYTDGYLISIEGDYWAIKDIAFTTGSKGIVLDNSNHSTLQNLIVHDIGEEAIHLRDGSSYNIVTSCNIYNTGRTQPGFGEGLYVGSDKAQHDTYQSACNDNTIENCVIGPNVTAEGVDIKEGTMNTIIRNCIFSAEGISGINSADAFINLKGAYGFVYGNTFNVDGSSVINTGIDFLDRGTGFNTGYRNAIFNNTFNLGNRASEISTARKKQGSPEQTHVWDNIRNPSSLDFPISDGTENVVTPSCPVWNIEPCIPVAGTNEAPTLSFQSPVNDITLVEGYNLQIEVIANDTDGTIDNVKLFIDNNLVRQINVTTYKWGHSESPNTEELNGLLEGTYIFKAVATDNEGASSETQFTLTVIAEQNPSESCNFNTPSQNGLENFNAKQFSNVYVLGTGGPSLSNLRTFTINWISEYNGLYQFSILTDNGIPDYYINLKPKITFQFQNANPELSISNSLIPNLDGDYWVTSDNGNFVMVSKTNNFTLYFSNDTTAPTCNMMRSTQRNETIKINDDSSINLKLFPNPAVDDHIFISAKNENLVSVKVYDLQGKLLLDQNEDSTLLKLNISKITSGTYVIIITGTKSKKHSLFVKK
ncbi:cellulase family glycosylhydrolase [Olleya sp. Bg11-27]|uniref:cellulase family glycosylhydrolase n=1 Tax=Olleya sp. Bg11-27 TaxID=2058135 RepID=UPI000C303447|nr:cellulase family glycosylhydrolase [Olleya sp. Bg11-27]AUC74935.1 hypothetical protein CW732_04295 [Olleya sp. Bg11-27]